LSTHGSPRFLFYAVVVAAHVVLLKRLLDILRTCQAPTSVRN
jgi:hypothetical protein